MICQVSSHDEELRYKGSLIGGNLGIEIVFKSADSGSSRRCSHLRRLVRSRKWTEIASQIEMRTRGCIAVAVPLTVWPQSCAVF